MFYECEKDYDLTENLHFSAGDEQTVKHCHSGKKSRRFLRTSERSAASTHILSMVL